MARRVEAPKHPVDAAIDEVAKKTTLLTAIPAIVTALRAIREESRRKQTER
jgi:hypothetical protein